MGDSNTALNSLINLLICLGPLAVVGAVIGGILFFRQYQKKQRKERLRRVSLAVKKIQVPEFKAISERGEQPNMPFTKTLSGGALVLHRIARGDLALLEKRTAGKFFKALQTYKSQAEYGKLPDDRLEELRRADLNRIEALMKVVVQIDQNAEAGNSPVVRQQLLKANEMIERVYEGHVELYESILFSGIQFPIPPPPPPALPPAQGKYDAKTAHIQYLRRMPPEAQTMFLMQYDSIKKDPTTAVLLTLFLGGIGAHKFYLGQIGLGLLYLALCWTSLPSWIALVELFTISGYVQQYNARKAAEIARALS